MTTTNLPTVDGDFELIINKVKAIYKEKNPILRAYRNIVLDLLEEFSEYSLLEIPRGQNQIANSLATSASFLKIPIFPNMGYEIEFKHRPIVADNINTGRFLKMINR